MSWALTEEQSELVKSARAFLGRVSPPATVRKLMETERGWDAELWQRIAGELMWPALHVPEAYDGAGFSYVETCLVMEELGRALCPSPFFGTVCFATNALLLSDNDALKRELLPQLAAGEATATLVHGCAIEAAERGDEVRLNGEASSVIDGHSASWLIVAATTSTGCGLYALPGEEQGVTRELLPTMDQTRKLARVRLDDVRVPGARALAVDGAGTANRAGAGSALLGQTLERAGIALAAEQVGGAEACLDMAVEYAKVRKQFGRPIGTFQAIQHKCADMLLLVESARSAARAAARAVGTDEQTELASLAKAYCSEAFFECASENIQIHGGIGFTWEHDAHLYFKRARASEAELGDPAHHRERVAVAIGL